MTRYIKNIQATKTVGELDNSFVLVSTDHEIESILDSINFPKCDYKYADHLFVKEKNGEYELIYGMTGAVPYLDHFVTLIYANGELVETF